MYCRHCGKEIADEAVICIHCGCETSVRATVTQTVYEDTSSSLDMWSMICGLASFFIGWFVLGITAMIMASYSKNETGGIMSSQAKVGYICGLISTVLSALVFFVILIWLCTL